MPGPLVLIGNEEGGSLGGIAEFLTLIHTIRGIPAGLSLGHDTPECVLQTPHLLLYQAFLQ